MKTAKEMFESVVEKKDIQMAKAKARKALAWKLGAGVGCLALVCALAFGLQKDPAPKQEEKQMADKPVTQQTIIPTQAAKPQPTANKVLLDVPQQTEAAPIKPQPTTSVVVQPEVSRPAETVTKPTTKPAARPTVKPTAESVTKPAASTGSCSAASSEHASVRTPCRPYFCTPHRREGPFRFPIQRGQRPCLHRLCRPLCRLSRYRPVSSASPIYA